MADALVDNDVLYKAAMYGLSDALIRARPFGATQFHMLEAARFIIRKKLTRKPPNRGAECVLKEFEDSLQHFSRIEPTPEETRIAAELEFLAKQRNLPLDAGESLLCAILISRNSDFLFTGDKRAIQAIQALFQLGTLASIAHHVACLEQLLNWMLDVEDPSVIRAAVCSEPAVDAALRICFSCSSNHFDEATCREALSSYIADLVSKAPDVIFLLDASQQS